MQGSCYRPLTQPDERLNADSAACLSNSVVVLFTCDERRTIVTATWAARLQRQYRMPATQRALMQRVPWHGGGRLWRVLTSQYRESCAEEQEECREG